jgi:hypothetical protein
MKVHRKYSKNRKHYIGLETNIETAIGLGLAIGVDSNAFVVHCLFLCFNLRFEIK